MNTNGICLITPFLRYDMTLELMDYMKQYDVEKQRVRSNVIANLW